MANYEFYINSFLNFILLRTLEILSRPLVQKYLLWITKLKEEIQN